MFNGDGRLIILLENKFRAAAVKWRAGVNREKMWQMCSSVGCRGTPFFYLTSVNVWGVSLKNLIRLHENSAAAKNSSSSNQILNDWLPFGWGLGVGEENWLPIAVATAAMP